MTIADTVRDQALALGRSGSDMDDAVRRLEVCCEGRRVAVVRARQQVQTWVDSEPDRLAAMRAVVLLDALLDRLPA
jgi:hypothetical protein